MNHKLVKKLENQFKNGYPCLKFKPSYEQHLCMECHHNEHFHLLRDAMSELKRYIYKNE